MKKILTIGGATQDIFISYEHAEMVTYCKSEVQEKSYMLLQEGKKIEVQNIHYATGGGATNSAVSFKRLGFNVSTFVKVSEDIAAQEVLKKLEQEGINTEFIKQETKGSTGVSFILPTVSGDRIIFAYRGINGQVVKNDIPFDSIKEFDQLYITSLSGNSSDLFLPISKQAKEHDIYVATNPGSSQLAAGAEIMRESLPYIDTFILNAEEAKIFMLSLVKTSERLLKQVEHAEETLNPDLPELLSCHISYDSICFSLPQFFKEVLKRGPKIVVVTNGAEGVYVATKEHILFHPSLEVDVYNTIGAGDAFGSSFTASLVHGKSIEESLVSGICNAASVISYLDTKEGLLTLDKLENNFKKVGINQIQYFSFSSVE
ncbi:MAG: carbohydrate kinase family protein [Candidatus Babeliales bacterium]